MLNLAEYQKKPRQLSDYLPWAGLVAPGVVLNKDGSFQRTIRYRGPDLDSSTPSELVATIARINNILRRLGEGWALYFEANRHPSTHYPKCSFPDFTSYLIDLERRKSFEQDGLHFESTYYLTFVYLPPSDHLKKASDYLFEDDNTQEFKPGRYQEHLDRFLVETNRTLELLTTLFPEVHCLDDEQTLSFLHHLISTKNHKVKVPDEVFYLDSLLADTPLSGGLSPKLGPESLNTISILGFPNTTVPGILDELNDLGFAYRWVTRWIPMDKSKAEATLKRIRRQWFVKRKSAWTILQEVMFNRESPLLDSDAANKTIDTDEALQELGSDDVSYGYITTTLTVRHKDQNLADDMILNLERVINSRGFVTIRETFNALEAWLGSLPGHVYANVRRPIVHSINLAHMMPVSDIWAGADKNEHLKGPPLLFTKTKGATPFRLSLHVGDVGHSMVVGPTGSGKSVLLSMIALQFCKYKEAQIFFFDKGRSARAVILSLKGKSFDLNLEGDVCFQPLCDIDNPASRAFALEWLLNILTLQHLDVTPDLKQNIWTALESLSTAPKSERTLTGLSLLLQTQKIKQAIAPFTLAGAFGHLLDADKDSIPNAPLLHFEMEDLLSTQQAVLPVLTYVFHKLEARFDGSPTLLILDEAWVFLDTPLFANKLKEWLKTLRKKNVSVIFAAQSLSDIAQSKIATTLIESCPTRIFLPNERALEPQIYKIYQQFGLNDRQVSLISQAQPKQDYYLQTTKGNRLFELGLGPLAKILCGASTPKDHQLMDCVLKEDPANFLDVFLRKKGFAQMADEILKRQTEWQVHQKNSSQIKEQT